MNGLVLGAWVLVSMLGKDAQPMYFETKPACEAVREALATRYGADTKEKFWRCFPTGAP